MGVDPVPSCVASFAHGCEAASATPLSCLVNTTEKKDLLVFKAVNTRMWGSCLSKLRWGKDLYGFCGFGVYIIYILSF